jgi:hypothetical protein
MAIIFNNQQERSELQQRIAAELREKQASKNRDADLHAPEYDNETSAYLKQTKVTTSLAWAWALIALAVVGTVVIILIVIS